MALSVVARGTGTHNASATTFTLSPSGTLAAGSLAVLVIAADNAEALGVAFTFFGVTDDKANLWTRRVTPLYDPGAANAGVTGAQFTTDMAGGVLTSASVITVTFDTATTAKAWVLWEVVPDAGKVPSYVTSGVNAGAATAAPTVTSTSITSGDVIIGALHNEYGTTQVVTADADVASGSWSAQQAASIGTTTAGMNTASQYKVVTGTATQTYNPTMGTSSNVILSWIQVTQIPFLTVGAVDQTSFVLLSSLSLKYNTFDFALKNPATKPVLGNTVTLGGPPGWTGTIASVRTTDATLTYGIVNITATNSNVAAASAATFGLSDAPNNVTTFGFRDMSVTLSTNLDATTTTTGTCTIRRAGLWPAMTFQLTSASRGYVAQSFSVRDVIVTWLLRSQPIYRITFGDPIVTMSVWVASQAANAPDGSISGTKITDLSVTTPKLAANSVTAAKIAAGTITANEIAAALSGTISFTGGAYIRGASQIFQVDANGAAFDTNLQVESTAGRPAAIALHVAGETYLRASLNTTNKGLVLGSGAAQVDTYLYRSAAKTLRIDADGAGGFLTNIQLDATTVTGSTFVASAFQEGAKTGGIVPSGGIIMWKGSVATIPTGWYLCDGTNGTPNLSDRFVIAAGGGGTPGDIGGTLSPRVALTTHASQGGHTHDSHTASGSAVGMTAVASGSGASGQGHTHVANPVTHANQGAHTHDAHAISQWYVLAYIMRS